MRSFFRKQYSDGSSDHNFGESHVSYTWSDRGTYRHPNQCDPDDCHGKRRFDVYLWSGRRNSNREALSDYDIHRAYDEQQGECFRDSNGYGISAQPAITITATPTTIIDGASSTLTVTATNATQVTVTGTDGSSYTLQPTGGTQSVSPTATVTYTATATGTANSVTATVTSHG